MSRRPAAVVVGLDCIAGLQAARILAARGVPVVGIFGDRRHFASRTRVCQQVLQCELTTERLIEELERLGPTLGPKAVLFPCTDASVLVISRHRDRLAPWYHILLPEHDVVATLMDKVSFIRYAQTHGLPIPKTLLLAERSDAEAAATTMTYPCVLKPPLKTARWQQHTRAKVFRLDNPEQLLRVYDQATGWADLLIVQEWVEGGEDALYSCNAYFDAASVPLATFVARKIRQWPPHTGTSSLGEECRNAEVLDETVRLFTGAGFHGLAYLEMKRDSRTGRHVIIEPNVGRPTGRSAIAERGGVELLSTAYCDALGLPLPPARQQRYRGVKWIDLRRDLQSAAYFVWRRELSLRRWWLSVRGPKAHAVVSARDPMPFLVDLAQTGARAFGAVRRLPDGAHARRGRG